MGFWWPQIFGKVFVYFFTLQIIRLDARNHGDSTHSENMSYKAMSSDVLKVMDDLEIERACLMGHSMGGKAFMTTALLHVS